MKNVLCYGDSNTWGYNAQIENGRHGRWERWTGIAQAILGDNYYLIEEGLNGRTTVWEDPIEEHRNGKTYLIPCLMSHKPLDLVIVMLGSNDMKRRFDVSAYDIALGAGKLIDIIQNSNTGTDPETAPAVLLVSPPPISDMTPHLAHMFAGATEKQPLLADFYRQIAEERNCGFVDTSFLEPDPADGLHLTVEGQRQLGERIAEAIQQMVG